MYIILYYYIICIEYICIFYFFACINYKIFTFVSAIISIISVLHQQAQAVGVAKLSDDLLNRIPVA